MWRWPSHCRALASTVSSSTQQHLPFAAAIPRSRQGLHCDSLTSCAATQSARRFSSASSSLARAGAGAAGTGNTSAESSSDLPPVAASSIVTDEQDADLAAARVADLLVERLHGRTPACTFWFAKGYGPRSLPIGKILQERLGGSVVVGSNSEGGVIGDGTEVQSRTFALSALSVSGTGFRALPFHAADLSELPHLGRSGTWSEISQAEVPPSVAAFCTLPMIANGDPHCWVGLFDRALAPAVGSQATASGGGGRLPSVVGGLTVGNHVFVDGEAHVGGGFGVVLDGPGMRADAVVCQGAEPFGPFLKITGVQGDSLITEINGRNPQDVLMPILHSPAVPGRGSSMAGIFVDPTPVTSVASAATVALAGAALGGRPSSLIRPMHRFTPEGALLLSPLTESLPYAAGMQLQLHCFSPDHALGDLRSRAENDMFLHDGRPPDAAIIISCGARGNQMYSGQEGVESALLREVWGRHVPTVGFFAGGEFGPVGLKTYMHSYTTSCLMLRSRSLS